MATDANIYVQPEAAADEEQLKVVAARVLSLPLEEVKSVKIVRRSIDARRGDARVRLKLEVYTGTEEPQFSPLQFDYQNVTGKPPVIIVGAGPAGLFAALRLLERGLRPVILEQGKSVKERKYDISRIRKNVINPSSNWCFGEGGAGAYSDGKLYTRSNKRGNIYQVLQQLANHGADPDIVINAHAHIGTDQLPRIIANIRETITTHGGEYYFKTKVTNLIVSGSKVLGVETANGTRYEGIAVILATGHSARDIYELFFRNGWAIEAKPFAMGLRVEHPQALINDIQYGANFSSLLPPASYSLATQVNERGVFSFCMCPGGIMVPAATAPGEIVVNGMSNALRNSPYANAGIVVQVNLSDASRYTEGPLAGMRFQQDMERIMFRAANYSQQAPAQRLVDFVNQRPSSSLQKTSYIPGVTNVPLYELLPRFMVQSLQQAFKNFDRKMRGYLSDEAMLVAVESRTSSPVRIPRNTGNLQHIRLRNLYPCGEGSGYAGGITSAAIDGMNCADKCADQII